MRLYLNRIKCKSIALNAEIVASESLDRRISEFAGSFLYRDNDEQGQWRDCLFRSEYRVAEAVEYSFGLLTRSQDDGQATFRLILANFTEKASPRGAPVSSFKPAPFTVLLDAVPDLFGALDFRLTGCFEYASPSEFSSVLPIPWNIPSTSAQSFTQVDQYQLNHTDPEGREYSITIEYAKEEELVLHTVVADLRLELNRKTYRRTRTETARISRSLVTQQRP